MKTILVTGFEPFGHTPVNPAEHVARALDGVEIEGARIVARVVPSSFFTCIDVVRAVLVTAHQARIASDIRCQDRRQTSCHSLASQEASAKAKLAALRPRSSASLHIRYWPWRCRPCCSALNVRSLRGPDRSTRPDHSSLPAFGTW